MKIKYLTLVCSVYLLALSNLLAQSNINIVPQPQNVTVGTGTFTVNSETSIYYTPGSKVEAVILKEFLQKGFRSAIKIDESKKQVKRSIIFKANQELANEAYELIITKKGIQIIASSSTGWFYGVQSLKQLFSAEFGFSEVELTTIDLPQVIIKDSPRFSWRAFMLDEGRHFKGIQQVKLLLNEMARLKINVFHWHLVDDQGWRIEIKKYPLLTEIGSTRKSTQVGPLHNKSPIQSAEPHSGFYTQDEIKEIVKYASERHITVVPEIEMPGHSSAAIASYTWLGTNKIKIEVPIKFGISQDVYDVSDPNVYAFLTDVLDEVMELFPSKVIHIGGDEVKYHHWKNSETVRAYMKENQLATPAELQVFFTNRISNYLEEKGRNMMGWNEILGQKLHWGAKSGKIEFKRELAKGTIIHFWKGDISMATEAASKGYKIVNSLHSETYLDYDYNTTSLSDAYAFDPIPEGLDAQYHNKIIGTGCQMWGAWIPTNGEMHFMVFPRIAAYAEVGWTQIKNKSFENFKLALPYLQKKWEQNGIYYAPDTVVEKEKNN